MQGEVTPMGESVNTIAFLVLALAAVGGAVGMLTSRNIMYAAFWLLWTMLSVGGLYLLLSAEFLALIQVMVYAGAVSVLMLFVIMLTLRRREDAVRPLDFSPSAALLAAVFLGIMYYGISNATFPEVAPLAEAPNTADLGVVLFTMEGGWLLPFEISALVLLAALVAAVWWTKGQDSK